MVSLTQFNGPINYRKSNGNIDPIQSTNTLVILTNLITMLMGMQFNYVIDTNLVANLGVFYII